MKVIIDCDSGNDDSWAIISLLKCEQKCDFKVVAITHVNGNTTCDHSTLNTLMVLKSLNRLDVPVFKGAESSLIENSNHYEPFHGIDGFGMIYAQEEKPSRELIREKHAVFAIKELIDENPNEIVLIAIGPLTNIALLYKLYPGISAKVKSLHIMGGSYLGVGNVSACAEFNFWSDPESVHIVLAETKCPITIFPWEPSIEAGHGMPFDDWRIKKLASNNNPFTNLLDPVEIKAYKNILSNWTPCDCFLATCFIAPKLIKKSKSRHVTIELAGNHTRGQMIIDHLGKNVPNALVIEEIDVELFKKLMLWICGHDDSSFDFDYELK